MSCRSTNKTILRKLSFLKDDFSDNTFAKIAGPITFLLNDLECFFFNVLDIQLILEFKHRLRKYHPVFSKTLKSLYLNRILEFRFLKKGL